MKIDGGCHCGALCYEAEINPDYVVICHCTDCQASSGGPYRASVPVKTENFHLRGTPKTYVKSTADSGTKRVLAFCGDCGSSLYSAAQGEPPIFNLRIGSVNQRALLPPKFQGFCRSALPWAMDLSIVAQIPDQTRKSTTPDRGAP